MYNSNKGNSSGSFSGSGKSTDGSNGSSSRFQNKNLNSSVKAPAALTSTKPGLAVIRGNKGVGKSIGGAAAPTATLAPVPLNTPSAKRENNGRDPNVNIVQPRSTGGVWGQASSGGTEDASPIERPNVQPASALSKPAPWAKSVTASTTVDGNATSTADSTSAKTASFRPQTASWADVDIDSEDDDDAPRAAASAAAPAVSRVIGTVQAARPPEPQAGFGYNNLNQSNDYRKERSSSFSNEQDRRFNGFSNNNSFQQQDDRFNNHNNNNNRAYPSGDARFNGNQQGHGEFGRQSYGGGQFSSGFGNSPNNLSAMRNPNNSFGPRGGPVPVGGAQFSNSAFPPQAQRPPAGDFSRVSSQQGFGAAQSYPYLTQASMDPALRAIEEARNEVQELEAKKLRKRTMSSEEYAPAAPTAPAASAPTNLQGQAQGHSQVHSQSQSDREYDHRDPHLAHQQHQQQQQGFGRRDGYGQPQHQQAPDQRWGAPRQSGPDDYHNNSNNNFYAAGHGGGYGYGGESQRVPYRTRGPSFDNSGPDGANRSFGTGGNVPLHGQQYSMDSAHHSHSEPMWERVKVQPVPVQQPPQLQRLQAPYGADPAGDRWNQRQQLPPPPALHVYGGINSNAAPAGVPPSGYRPDRERGPRSGNTPREGEADRNAPPAPRAAVAASPVVSDRRTVSNSSPYDPSKPFASLFGGKSSQEGAYPAQEPQVVSHEDVIRANRVHNPTSEQSRAGSYEQELRSQLVGSAGPRPKVLYDPQSNEYRPLEKEVPKAPFVSKVPAKKTERAGPPAAEDVNEEKVARKALQVNRIEQNADKWSRAKDAAPAVVADATAAVRSTRHSTEGHEESAAETQELSREEYLAERKALRLKERLERGPRTKGFLFRFNADGNIERVLTAEEIEAKARKTERAAAPRSAKRSAEDSEVLRTENANFDHLDFDNLTKEEFQSLPKAIKEEIRAKHQAEKAARRAGLTQDARESKEKESRETRETKEPQLSQYGSETEDLGVGNLNIGYNAPSSGGHDHSDLDIQQMARESDAHRSLQPIKAFVPGQGYGQPLDTPPLQNWREGAQVIPAARHEPQPYPSIIQPHNYPIIHQPHQAVVNLGHEQSWNFPSYIGVSEPALFGGNTSFLGQQESTIDQRFSALQSLRSDADVEITESYEAREHHKGATIARERGPSSAPSGVSAEREFGGRGAGRGERGERPGRGAYAGRGERSDRFERMERPERPDRQERFERPRRDNEDGAAPEREAHGGRFSSARSGRGGRGPPAEEGDHDGEARGRGGYAGRGGRGEGRGEGRGDRGEGRGEGRGGRGSGRGGRGGREYKSRAGPPSEPASA